MLHTEELLALAGSPYQWAVAALVAVAIFAPRILPFLARLAGMEIKRRAGLPPAVAGRQNTPALERTETPAAQRESLHPSVAPVIDVKPLRRSGGPVTWWAAAIVCGAVAVLSWYLLHTR